jgi:PAS domain S-box-containing protein/putative nucleotidyltransferase with HDIG domain
MIIHFILIEGTYCEQNSSLRSLAAILDFPNTFEIYSYETMDDVRRLERKAQDILLFNALSETDESTEALTRFAALPFAGQKVIIRRAGNKLSFSDSMDIYSADAAVDIELLGRLCVNLLMQTVNTHTISAYQVQAHRDFAFGLDKKKRCVLVNQALCDFLQQDAQDMVGKDWIKTVIQPEKQKEELAWLKQCFSKKDAHTSNVQLSLIKQDSQASPVLWSCSVLRDEKNQTQGLALLGNAQKQYPQVEHTIKTFEQNFQDLFNCIRDGLAITDHNRIILHCNPAFLQLFGYTSEEVVGKNTKSLYEGEQQYNEFGRLLNSQTDKDSFVYMTTFKKKDGTIFTGEIRFHLLLDENNSSLGYVSMIRDVTRRVNADKLMQEVEKSLRDTLMVARLSQWVYNIAEETFEISGEFLKIFDSLENQEKINKTDFINKWVHPDDRQLMTHAFDMSDGKIGIRAAEFRIVRMDKSISYIYAELTKAVTCQDGKFSRLEGILQDVTERKSIEEALRKREERYKQQLNEMIGGFLLCDVIRNEFGKISDFCILETNHEFERITGKKKSEAIGKSVLELFTRLDLQFYQFAEQVCLNHETIQFVHYFEETETWLEIKIFSIESEKIGAVFFEVTDREKSNRDVQQRNRYLQAMQETTFELVSQHNLQKLIENIVFRALELFDADNCFLDFMQPDGVAFLPQVKVGDLADELQFPIKRGEGLTGTVWETGKPLIVNDYDNWPHRIPNLRKSYLQSIMGVPLVSKGEILGVLVLAKKFGAKSKFEEIDIEIILQFTRLATIAIENAQLMNQSQDEIRDRIHTEEKLRKSEEEYRSLFQNVPIGVYRIAEDGSFLTANPAFLKIFGFHALNELIQQNVDDFFIGSTRKKDFPYLFSKNHDTLELELQLKHKSGKYISVLTNSQAIRDAKGKIIFIEGTLTDISERKQAEQLIINQSEELNRLYRASGILISDISNSLPHLAQTIVETTAKEFHQINCSLFIYDESELCLNRLAFIGPSDGIIDTLGIDVNGRGVVAKCFRDGEILYCRNVEEEESYIVNWSDAKSELSIPLKVGEKMIGVLDIESAEINAFNNDDIRLLRIFSEKASLVLHQSILNAKEQKHLTSLMQLQKMSTALSQLHDESAVVQTLVEHTPIITGAPLAMVFLFNNSQTVLSLGASSAAIQEENQDGLYELSDEKMIRAIKTNSSYMVTDIDAEAPFLRQAIPMKNVRSLSTFSLFNEDKCIGAIAIAGKRLSNSTKEEDTTNELIAKIASTSINNARLFESTNRNLERMASLRRIDMAIASSTDMEFTVGIVLEQLMNQLHIDAASVLLFNESDYSLKYCSGRGYRTTAFTHAKISIGDEYAGRVVKERKSVFVHDLRIDHHQGLTPPFFEIEGFITYIGVPIIARGVTKGVLEVFKRSPFMPSEEWMDYLEIIGGQTAIAIESINLFSNLQRSNADLSLAYDNTLEGWASALELRDKETEGHTQRVADLTVDLAMALKVKPGDLMYYRWGALLHDIGKMAIPDEILLKPGALTEDEWRIMRMHPQYAYDMLSKISYLRPAMDIPYAHHEKWDGTGYPRGLQGEEIPYTARIFSIVDVWDALTSDRPYRKAWTKDKTLQYIIEQGGIHFDPKVLEAFIPMITNHGMGFASKDISS